MSRIGQEDVSSHVWGSMGQELSTSVLSISSTAIDIRSARGVCTGHNGIIAWILPPSHGACQVDTRNAWWTFVCLFAIAWSTCLQIG
jgi:hypothetical protein